MATSGLRYLGHESRKLADLFHSLGRSELDVVASQGSPLGLPIGRPVPGALRRLHTYYGTTTLRSELALAQNNLGVVTRRLGDGAAEDSLGLGVGRADLVALD